MPSRPASRMASSQNNSVPSTPSKLSSQSSQLSQSQVFGCRSAKVASKMGSTWTPSRVDGKTHFLQAAGRKNTTKADYQYKLVYRYVEGYTNAVKRKVLVKDW